MIPLRIILIYLFLLLGTELHGADYYVKTTGNNGLDGTTWAKAWRTIGHASSNVPPGNVINVADGIYNEQVIVGNSGSPGSYITFKSFNEHKAIVDGSGQDYCFYLSSKSNIKIKGFIIKKADNSWDSAGVYIEDDSVDNFITNNQICSNRQSGICFDGYDVDNNVIANNEIYDYSGEQNYGVYITHGDNNIIRDNLIHNNDYCGVRIYSTTTNNYISNNQIYSNGTYGIYMYSHADNNKIINNDIYGPDQDYGIYFYDSDNNIISDNNKIYNHDLYGMYLYVTENNTITNNQIYSNSNYGIYIGYYRSCNNKIANNEIYGPNQDRGIYINDGDTNIISENNEIYNHDFYGIYIDGDAEYNIISGNNKIHHNGDYGIYFTEDAGNNKITNNQIYSNLDHGIGCTGNADNNIISGNHIYGNPDYGIYFNSNDADNNVIAGNNVYGPDQDYGIYINDSDNNIVNANNLIHNNDIRGINFNGSATSNSIINNQIYSNSPFGDGIYIAGSSSRNTIASNNIHENFRGIYLLHVQFNYIGRRNNLYNNQYGIVLEANTYSNVIQYNDCFSNSGQPDSAGIIIKNSVYYKSGNMLRGNYCYKNPTGIRIIDSAANYLVGNGCYSNTDGVHITGGDADENSLWYNNISENNKGVYITNADNTWIMSGNNVYNNTNGIYITGNPVKTYISNSSILNNNDEAVYLNGSSVVETEVKYSYIVNNSIGIRINEAQDSFINVNHIMENTNGILLENSANDNYIQYCNITNNFSYGINILTGANDNLIYHCKVSGNNSYGIRSDNGDANYFVNNDIFKNNNDGVYIGNDSDNNILQKNKIYDNTGDGIEISANSDNNLIINNTLFQNNPDGINNANGSTILKNLITKNNNNVGINSGPVITVTYSCVNDGYGGAAAPGIGSIVSDPIFCDESIHDFHLKWNSPCIGTGEANNVPSCMGAHTFYIRLADEIAGNITFATVYFTTGYKIGSIPSKGAMHIHLDEEVFGLNDVTTVTGLSSWGGDPGAFTAIIPFDPLDELLKIYRNNDGNPSTDGMTENLLIKSIFNAAIGTNHRFHLATRRSNSDIYYIEFERSNDFRITGFSNFYVQWSHPSASDSNPGTRNLPWKTIQHAANVLEPGEVVTVLPGTQYESVTIQTDGKQWGQVITYKAEGNVIVTPNSNGTMLGPYAFLIDDADWIRINGFRITGSTNTGIYIKGSENVMFRSNRVYGNTNYGYKMENSDNCFIRYCRIYNNNIGVLITNGKTNWVRGNTIYNNGDGIKCIGKVEDSRIYDNNVYNNDNGCIFLKGDEVSYNGVWNNNCYSGLYGIKVTNSDCNRITGNTNSYCTNGILITGNTYSNIISGNLNKGNKRGIWLIEKSVSNIITCNICSNNNEGISLSGDEVRNNPIATNICVHNEKGIFIDRGRNIIGQSNKIGMNDYGIYFNNFTVSNTITNNKIYANIIAGIYFNSDSIYNNLITGNEIYGPDQPVGIFITNSDNNIISGDNKIHHNYDSGIYFTGSASNNIITNNKIYFNVYYGIHFNGSNVINNKIACNDIYGPYQDVGIYFTNANNNMTSGNNKIHDNEDYGIYYEGSSKSNTITDNQIYSSGYYGIFFNGNNIENNKITGNEIYDHQNTGDCGIYFTNVKNNIITENNKIHNNYIGIYLQGTSSLLAVKSNTISYNQIYSNTSSGIQGMHDVKQSRIIGNKIHGPDQNYGIYFPFIGGMGWGEREYNLIYSNVIHNNDISGIYLYKSVEYNIITNNVIYSNSSSGITLGQWDCQDNKIINNKIYGSGQSYGVRFDSGSDNIIDNNVINNHNNYGVYLPGSYDTVVTNNQISSNNIAGIYSSSAPSRRHRIKNNNIFGSNQNYGIHIRDGDDIIISGNNKIHHNDNYGIYFTGDAQNNGITNNQIYSNTDCGIYFNGDSVDNNTIRSNKIYGPGQNKGISIYQGDNNDIIYNELYQNNISGILLTNSATGTRINKNNVYSNSLYGIFLDSDSADNNYILTNNIWGENQDYGIFIHDGDNNIIQHNYISQNQLYGMYISGSTGSEVQYNDFYYNLTGIGHENSTSYIYLNNIINNTNGVCLVSGGFQQFEKNNLQSNTGFSFCNQTAPVKITNNWFGTTIASSIASSISNNGENTNFIPYRLFGEFNILENADNEPIARVSWVTAYQIGGGTNIGIKWKKCQDAGEFIKYVVYRAPESSLWSNLTYTSALTQINQISTTNITNFNVSPGNYAYFITILDDPSLPVGSVYTNECWYSPGAFVIASGPWFGPFFVDDFGDDTNPGTFENPFQTIQKAANVMSIGLPVCTISSTYIFPGTYSEQVSIYSNKNSGYMVFTKLSNFLPVMDGFPSSNFAFQIKDAGYIHVKGFKILSYSNGIYLDNSTNCQIESCEIFSNGYGIKFYHSYQNRVTNNVIAYNTNYLPWPAGIYFDTSANENYITDNRFSDQQRGIDASSGETRCNVITNNIFRRCSKGGIKLQYSKGYKIVDNQFYQCDTESTWNGGLYLLGSVVSNYIGNNLFNTNFIGIRFDGGTNNIIINNIIGTNFESCIYFEKGLPQGNLIKNNILYKAKYNGIKFYYTKGSNLIISNRCFYNHKGMEIQYTTNLYIQNNILTNNYEHGLYIENSKSNTIENNICNINAVDGIHIKNTDFSVVNNNICSNQSSGIYMENSYQSTIYGNRCNNNSDRGIFVNNLISCMIKSNICYDNNKAGVYLLSMCRENIIKNNRCTGSTWAGIIIQGNHNKIFTNWCYKNSGDGIKVESSSTNNVLTGNYCYTNNNYGIFMYNANVTSSTLINNICFSNKAGISLEDGGDNYVFNNECYNNYSGIKLTNSSSNQIERNEVYYNTHGLCLNNTTGCSLFRNAIYHNNRNGIWLDSADNNYIINNSVASNGQVAGYDGLYINNSDNNTIKNNIIAFTKNGYGINRISGVGNFLTYNDVFNNSSGNYNNVIPGVGTITNNPLWLSYQINSSNFLYLSTQSPCIDAGDPADTVPPNSGLYIDMGWKEFTRPFARVHLLKSITNVKLGGIDETIIPGSTVSYKISYQVASYGGEDVDEMIIYDKILPNTTFQTDFFGTASGFSQEYSTNINPNQGYTSSNYTNVRPLKDEIKWVRWKKLSESGGNEKTMFLKIIIK